MTTGSDPSRIATKFNNFLANIGPSLASEVPSTQFSHKDCLAGHFADCFFLNPTSPAEVVSIVHSLKSSKCEGVDGLSMSPVKETIDLLQSRDISIRYFQHGGVCLHFTRASFNTVFSKSNFKITLIFSKKTLHFNYIV